MAYFDLFPLFLCLFLVVNRQVVDEIALSQHFIKKKIPTASSQWPPFAIKPTNKKVNQT
jgi:hypothetical protein